MKSIANIGSQPAGIPILADNITEFHAARLLLLLRVCGVKGSVEGLTKLAKLDFFVRYPHLFTIVETYLLGSSQSPKISAVESSMVRHHYGPWDKRYYHVLPYLEAKGLVSVTKAGKTYKFDLTQKGSEVANALSKESSFKKMIVHMKSVKQLLGKRTGSSLKNLIYELFEHEVARKQLGDIIE